MRATHQLPNFDPPDPPFREPDKHELYCLRYNRGVAASDFDCICHVENEEDEENDARTAY